MLFLADVLTSTEKTTSKRGVSQHRKDQTNLDFNEARDDGVAVASAGPYAKIICTLLQTDNHTSTSSLNFFTGQMLFLTPNQQCQITEGQC